MNPHKKATETKPEPFEQRVCRQLIEALLFEQVVDYQYAQGTFNFVMNQVSYQARGTIASFGRVRLVAGSICYQQGPEQTEVTLQQLIDDLPANNAIKETLNNELQQTIKLCQWNQQHLLKPSSRRALSYLELESALDEGHPYHPCFKARTGFSLEDHALYGPESGNSFQLHWLAIDHSLLQQALPQKNRDFWLAELGAETLVELELRLFLGSAETAYQPNRFNLMPIHPWQWKSIGQSLLGELMEQDKIIHLGPAGDYYQATISVRTLVNVTHPDKPNIKLPMNMVNSSSLRTIEPHSVCTAPFISQWLNTLIQHDRFIQDRQHLGLLDEYAGIVLDENKAKEWVSDPAWASKIEGQLAVIFRKSLTHETPDALSAVPFPALMTKELDEKPFVDLWVNEFGIDAWVRRLIDVTLIPVWHLLVHHGIALEAHGQNMVLLHRNGWPEKVVLRDFHESLEYQKDYLAEPSLIPDFANLHSDYTTKSGHPAPDNQYFWMDSVEALRELIVDTLFVFNLTEVSHLLSVEYGFSENKFWQIVDAQLTAYAEEGHTPQARISAIPLDAPYIQAESLIKKKLSGQRAGEFHHTIPNPLRSGTRLTRKTPRQPPIPNTSPSPDTSRSQACSMRHTTNSSDLRAST
ncbi:IucA/IucC family protein [Alkalimarinus coralli]|uniref:IucA/IucC family protein n=1 Tax=Alkalimarinus coralli TaxID=2935863 RepID=UPI00202B34F1|nr:IucA/IucC family protein [Alkalimarinus coralli]